MRLLALDEGDVVLFNSQVNRTLYTVYRDNADAFTLMWKQQGTGYWLKFCISLRSVLQKQGFSIQLSAFELNHFETFCINLAKLLTGKHAVAVHTYVKDVVSVSRFHQLLINIPGVFFSKYIQEPTPAFMRLFGSSLENGNVLKVFLTLPLHLRAAGCLLRLLERWLVAEDGDPTDKSWWHVPQTWHHGSQFPAGLFEIFLKRKWKSELLSLLDVHPRDICWWNDLPEEGRVTMCRQRNTSLGSFIAAVSKKFDYPLSACDGLLVDELFYHHIITSCPRGKFKILSSNVTTVVFEIALCRGLYLVDSMAAFHPYSQAIVSFSNVAIASFWLWYGPGGMVSAFHRWSPKPEKDSRIVTVPHLKDEMYHLLHTVSAHLIYARMAMELNSKFHDSLYGDVTWTSPVTLVRLPWNIPLLTNWLEVLLIQIYKFERFFIPLCHFPLSKSVVSLVESVYRKVSEGKFLVKTCLIVADGILKRKIEEASVCYKPRKLLYDVVPRLSHYMKFLEREAYRILEVILRNGWNKEEQESGESAPLTDRIKVDLSSWNSVPDIDEYYGENFRHINYWITGAEWPEVEGGEEYFTEALEMLRKYKPGSKTHVEMKEPYKFSLFVKCAQSRHLNFYRERLDRAQEIFFFVTSVLKLLQEDGWLSPMAQKGFFVLFGLHFDLGHMEMPNSRPNANGQKIFEQMLKLTAVYYVASCLIGDTWRCEIAGQNAFAQLQRNETLAIMADIGARLNVLLHMDLETVVCPPAQYFKDAAAELRKHSTDSSLSIEEAMLLLKSLEKEATKKIDVSTAEALTSVKVPYLEEMPRLSDYINWLRYLENKRIQLLQLVSDQQFVLTQSFAKKNITMPVELFPQYDILEHRLVEEMASMQKCLELGELYSCQAYGLCRFLAHRFTWLQQRFVKWRKREHKFEIPLPAVGMSDLILGAIHIRIRMLAALIPLRALFYTYITKYPTTHPISEMTIDMFCEWTTIVRFRCALDMLNTLGSFLRDYIQALRQLGCKYFEKMLDHCYKVWVVAPFCSDPEATVEFGSIIHAQQIVTTFTQLFLMSYYVGIAHNCSFAETDKPQKMEGLLVFVSVVLRQVEIDERAIPQTWPVARQTLKKLLRDLWSDLVEMRKCMGPSVRDAVFPKWLGNSSPVWKEFFVMFVGSHYGNIIQKIAFSEFINTEDPGSDSASTTKVQTDPVTETNKSKANTKHMSPAEVQGEPDISLNGPANRRMESSISIKSNMPDGNAGNCDVTENKSSQNVHTKENKKQKKQHQNNEASKQDTPSENKALSKYKMCTYCKTVEPERHTYKKCSLCKKEGWPDPRFYCSKQCQENDWKAKHNMEHKSAKVLQ